MVHILSLIESALNLNDDDDHRPVVFFDVRVGDDVRRFRHSSLSISLLFVDDDMYDCEPTDWRQDQPHDEQLARIAKIRVNLMLY